MATEENAFYGWAGGALFVPLGARWGLIPEVGVGVYEQGDGKNLGGSLEFRSGLEATYRANDTAPHRRRVLPPVQRRHPRDESRASTRSFSPSAVRAQVWILPLR